MENTKKKSKAGRIIGRILLIVLALILIAALAVGIVWHNEIKTIASIKQLATADEAHRDCAVYTFTVAGGYYFDEFLEQGGSPSVDGTVSYLVRNITKGLFKMNLNTPGAGCTCFTAATSDGDRIMARNYDFSETNSAIVFTDPGRGRHASVSSVDLQFISVKPDSDLSPFVNKVLALAAPYVPMDGMNDAGVACGILMSYQEGSTQQNTDRPDLIASAMMRLVLDYADDLDEAVELVKSYDMHDTLGLSFHYFIADSSGRSAVLEYVGGGRTSKDDDPDSRELIVTWNDGPGYQLLTNYVIYPDYYSEGDELHGQNRFEIAGEYLDKCGAVVKDENEAMDILKSVGRRLLQDSPGVTVHSVVYNLTDCSVTWVSNEHYGEDAYTFRYSLR